MQFSNTSDVIDSRDIIERLEELTELASAVVAARAELGKDASENNQAGLAIAEEDFGEDERFELGVLSDLAEEGSGFDDWEHGETLIRDTYFKDYAQELAEECCEMPDDAKWPHTCIDWGQAADELQIDYSALDYDGITYWIRS